MAERDPIRRRLVRDGDKIVADWRQPGRAAILERNQRERGAVKKTEWAEPVMRVPLLDREVLKKRHPEVFQRGEKRAVEKFLNSSEGRPYRLSARGRSRPFSRGGI